MHSDHTTRPEPIKLCECGCGQPAPIAKWTDKRWGHVKGQPTRFVNGHQHVARTQSYRLHPNGTVTRKPLRPVADRFWEKVDQRGLDECWLWTRYIDALGYGRFRIEGKSERAHRVAFMLVNGPLSPETEICHSCDNPACCNPAHLWEGTHHENMMDMTEKARFFGAKLNEDAVREIRHLYQEGMTQAVIADRFGVGVPTISRIVNRTLWKHVA